MIPRPRPSRAGRGRSSAAGAVAGGSPAGPGPDRPDFPQGGDEVSLQALGLRPGDFPGGPEPQPEFLDAQGGPVQQLAEGESCVAIGYSGDAMIARRLVA